MPGGGAPVRYSAPDPLSALDFVAGYESSALFVLKDFHHYLEGAAALGKLRDLFPALGAAAQPRAG